jgi:hypothetical protein
MPMNLFSSTFAKRNTALVVLLVWVFALASGAANACLLEVRETHGHLTEAAGPGAVATLKVSAGHAGAVVGHDEDADASKMPCLKACADVAQSLPKQDLKAAQADPGPAPLVLVLWTAATPALLPLHQTELVQPLAPERPVRVRYSRLAL